MSSVLRVSVLFILVQKVFSTDSNDLFNTRYYSSSVLGLVKLLKMEQEFMENFSVYANILQEKVDNLNIFLDSLKRPSHNTHNEREKFVSNPLNAFGLIRRLNQDWPKWQNYSQKQLGLVQLNAMQDIVSAAPESFDMNEKLKAMHRIETTYDLQPKDIAKGLLQRTEFNYKLTWRDCLALAHHKFKIGEFQRSLLWFQETLNINTNRSLEIINGLHEMELNGFATDVAKRSIYLSNQALTNETIDKLANSQLQGAKPIDLEQLISSNLLNWSKDSSTTPPTNHNIGCRGLFPRKTNLVCRYNSSTNAFLKLAPLKMEEISRDPFIVMFHEVISDKEIEEMKGEIREMENGWTGLEDPKEIVSSVYWITEETSFSKRINQRISDMTGFRLEEFPAIQLANFGVGGYFKPHYDYYTERLREVDANNTLGDRIASIIFYAGEVSQGGQTVFPDLKVVVEHKKGNALFWFNDFDDSSPDPRSLHSVCPVIVGSRWTITKWLHYAPQLFVKPCSPRVRKE
ncbi:prolyl 4-hydroxylase subunit alpha-1 isoform X2 [Drosophila teissieri]|uniref:prolyl 4-hydroxylase subunit alpha-1 isoform X2 n=1 Tax=Drosophila teissieri TaxID=7243 RepID=UPI001CB9DCE6|nr:prolyl 4-hydroxylase subunit alpha-1 isoform X2 [Drosophila teissieri]